MSIKKNEIPCLGPGGQWREGDCGAVLPNDKYETMRKHGWDFTVSNDGRGENYYACSEHKDGPTE